MYIVMDYPCGLMSVFMFCYRFHLGDGLWRTKEMSRLDRNLLNHRCMYSK